MSTYTYIYHLKTEVNKLKRLRPTFESLVAGKHGEELK